ncbi:MAG: hypothetical protein KA383_01885 [Phycisphaerae bacterium]|nr:hypothetical protein [Phycisphaerae bacterium]
MASHRRLFDCLLTVALMLCAGVGVNQALADEYSDDPAGEPPSLPKPTATLLDPGLNDMWQPVAAVDTAAPRAAASQPDQVSYVTPADVSLAERLRAWDDDTRRNAQIQVELPSATRDLLSAPAREIEAAWDAGDYDSAIEKLAWLESDGASVALGVNWITPQPAGASPRFTDVRIGTRTGGYTPVLDYDAATGKLFAVVRWDANNGWALYQSTTDGNSWAETYFWSAGAGQQAVSVDMVVVSDYVYVGYVASNSADEARLRRCLVSTGAVDIAYAYTTVFDATPSTITEAKLAANTDSADNRIYYAVCQSDNSVRFAWDESTDGTSFTETSPAGVAADSGLDLCWNPGFATYYVFLSYIGTDSRVHVLRRSTTGWSEATSAPFDGSHDRSAISAYDDHIICAHELYMTNGQGIRYFITHDGGETWDYYNYIGEPLAGEGPYQMADVTARGGAGTAIVFTHETGEPDDVLIRYRRNYAPGLWHDAIRVNNNDVSTGTWTALSWTPRDTANNSELSYGLIYFYGTTPYYNRFQRRIGDLNCDEAVNFGDINPFVLALSNPGAYDAVYPDCDPLAGDCNGDLTLGFGDINPFVTLLSSGD